MDTYFFGIFTFVLLLFSAFFAAAETAITTASEGKIHSLSKHGNKNARIISNLRKDKNSLISALLFGNNAVNIMASSMITTFTINHYGEEFLVYSTAFMTVIIIVFGEILPKTYAVHNALATSLFVAPVLFVIFQILRPFASVMNLITRFFLSFSKKNEGKSLAIDEIRGTIDLYHHLGNVLKYDRDMLDNILEMSDVEVGHIMTHRKNIYSLSIDENVDDLIEKVLDSTYSRIPIWEDNPENLIGLIHIRDLIKLMRIHGKNMNDQHVRGILKKAWFIPENTLIRNQLLAFRQQRQHFAFIIDEYGDLQGLITLEDILEQIVGNIEDESDKINPEIFKISDRNYLVSGHVTIRDLNKKLHWKLSDDHANTIAGFVINALGEIPQKGEIFQINEFEFKVMGKRNNQITKLLIKIYGEEEK